MSTAPIDPACPPPPPELDPHIAPEELPSEDIFTKAFAELLPIADTIDDVRLRPMNVHSELAYVNAKNGFAVFEPHFATARAIPGVDIEAIERVPRAALAVLGASHRLNLLTPPENHLPAKLLQGRKVRKALLHFAHAGATLGLLPEEPVKKIAKGTGSLDTARDLIELSILLRESEPILRGKLTVMPEVVAEAAELGTWLRNVLQPTNAPARPKATAAEVQKATLDRARMWTLLFESYSELQRVAAFLRVDVPSLQSRRALKKKVKKDD